MNSIFRQLTTGVTFNKSKFGSDLQKFGLAPKLVEKNEEEEDEKLSLMNDFIEDRNENSSESGSESEDENRVLLFGGTEKILTQKKKKKKKKKETSKIIKMEMLNRFRKKNRIHVSGPDIPDPIDVWEKLKTEFAVPDNLISAVSAVYKSPTPIQMQAIPMMMDHRELLACAPTGSGKTAAYLIPLVHLLREPRWSKQGVRSIIISPTRELATQIHRECLKLCQCRGLKAVVMKSQTKKKESIPKIKADILISTPNRLVYMIKNEGLNLSNVEWLIVDESDKLFESGPSGFRDQLAVIYKACSKPSVKRAMFSATLAPDVENWCKLNLDNVVTVTIGTRNTATETVEQKLIYTGTEKGKQIAMKNLISEGMKPPVLIFVQTKERANELLKQLSKEGLRVDVVHSERSQLQRDNSVKAFRAGRIWVLICTELMGRGMDFKGVNLVINYDFPPTTISYIHRIGRTGRAGKTGKAITFFTDQDKTLLRSIAQIVKSSGSEVPDYMLHLKKASRQEKRKLAKFAPKRDSISGESKYDKEKREKKEAIIRASKARKRKQEEQQNQDNNKQEPEVKKPKKTSQLEPKKKKKVKARNSSKKFQNLDLKKKKKKTE